MNKNIEKYKYNYIHIYTIGYNPMVCDNMKATFEIDTEKGERSAKFSRISAIGQISGLKEHAGKEAIVLILGPKKEEKERVRL